MFCVILNLNSVLARWWCRAKTHLNSSTLRQFFDTYLRKSLRGCSKSKKRALMGFIYNFSRIFSSSFVFSDFPSSSIFNQNGGSNDNSNDFETDLVLHMRSTLDQKDVPRGWLGSFVTEGTQYCVQGGLQQIKISLANIGQGLIMHVFTYLQKPCNTRDQEYKEPRGVETREFLCLKLLLII